MKIDGFEWDKGNWPKCGKHGVSQTGIESVFDNQPIIFQDPHNEEARLRAIGKNTEGRFVYVIFTFREIDNNRFIRPISARYMHKKEIEQYEQR